MGEPNALTTGVGVVVLALFVVQAFLWSRVVRRVGRGEPAIAPRDRTPVPWGGDGAALAVVFLSVGWMSVLASDADPSEVEPMGIADAAVFALMAGLMATLSIGWMRSNYCVSWRDFGAAESVAEIERDCLLGVGAMVAMLLPVYLVQLVLIQLVGLPSAHPTVESLMAEPEPGVVAAALVTAVIVAPLIEELAFRVLLQGWLERLGGAAAWWPVVVSAAVFALAHAGQGWAPVPLFVLASGLGYVYRQTHRLAPVVAMHMAFNLLSVVAAVAQGVARAGEVAAVSP